MYGRYELHLTISVGLKLEVVVRKIAIVQRMERKFKSEFPRQPQYLIPVHKCSPNFLDTELLIRKQLGDACQEDQSLLNCNQDTKFQIMLFAVTLVLSVQRPKTLKVSSRERTRTKQKLRSRGQRAQTSPAILNELGSSTAPCPEQVAAAADPRNLRLPATPRTKVIHKVPVYHVLNASSQAFILWKHGRTQPILGQNTGPALAAFLINSSWENPRFERRINLLRRAYTYITRLRASVPLPIERSHQVCRTSTAD